MESERYVLFIRFQVFVFQNKLERKDFCASLMAVMALIVKLVLNITSAPVIKEHCS